MAGRDGLPEGVAISEALIVIDALPDCLAGPYASVDGSLASAGLKEDLRQQVMFPAAAPRQGCP